MYYVSNYKQDVRGFILEGHLLSFRYDTVRFDRADPG